MKQKKTKRQNDKYTRNHNKRKNGKNIYPIFLIIKHEKHKKQHTYTRNKKKNRKT